MSNNIGSNYSIANEYFYPNKSTFVSALDWLSRPLRSPLGGRKVYTQTLNCGKQFSVSKRIQSLLTSLILFPVAIVSAAALLLKLITQPCTKEKILVKRECAQTRQKTEAIATAHKDIAVAYQAKDYDRVIEIFKEQPIVYEPDNVSDTAIFDSIIKKIRQNYPWPETASAIARIEDSSAWDLAAFAVEYTLLQGNKTGDTSLKAADIISFIDAAIADKEDLIKCYDCLFERLFPLKFNFPEAVVISNISIAHTLLVKYEQMLADKKEIDALYGKAVPQGQEALLEILKSGEKIQELAAYPRDAEKINQLFQEIVNASKKDKVLAAINSFKEFAETFLESAEKKLFQELCASYLTMDAAAVKKSKPKLITWLSDLNELGSQNFLDGLKLTRRRLIAATLKKIEVLFQKVGI